MATLNKIHPVLLIIGTILMVGMAMFIYSIVGPVWLGIILAAGAVVVLLRWIGPKWAITLLFVGLMVYLLGPSNVAHVVGSAGDQMAGKEAPPPPPLAPDEQEALLRHNAQVLEREALAERMRATAAAQAAEAARLAERVSRDLPPTIRVVHCDNGWSEPVMIPAGWNMNYSWSGRTTQVEYLQDGEWKRAMTARIAGNVEAFRFCSTSRWQLELDNGAMPISWQPM